MTSAENKTFVSRGGVKLQAALTAFEIKVTNKTILDVGSSTGGFVDCLLHNGARKVYSLDTAYGELAWKLRQDPRVIVMERTNILHVQTLPERVDMVTIDASWTKLVKILPVVKPFLKEDGIIIALLKPHYETDKQNLIKGVVKPELVENIKNNVIADVEKLGFHVTNVIESPILGGGNNNKEYLISISPTSLKLR